MTKPEDEPEEEPMRLTPEPPAPRTPRTPQPPQPEEGEAVPRVPQPPQPDSQLRQATPLPSAKPAAQQISGDPYDPETFAGAKVRRQAAIFSKKIGDHYVLYDPLGHFFVRLNESAHRLWETVGDNERIAVTEVIRRCGCDFDDGIEALLTLARRNFLVIASL